MPIYTYWNNTQYVIFMCLLAIHGMSCYKVAQSAYVFIKKTDAGSLILKQKRVELGDNDQSCICDMIVQVSHHKAMD